MIEVLINLNDIEYANQLKEFIEKKEQFSVWNVENKNIMVNLLEKDIIKDNSMRIVITDALNKDIIDSCNIPYSCFFIYVCHNLGFEVKKENETKVLKTLNFENFITCLSMFEKTNTIINGRDIIKDNMYIKYNNLKDKLNNELISLYNNALDKLSSKNYIIVQGKKLTGKTHFAKTLAKDNLYILVDEKTDDIEEKIFGDIFNNKKKYNTISIPDIYIIVDNFDKLCDRLQMRIISAIKYKIYNKNNDNRQLDVKANFILTCNNETRAIKRLNNIIKLPDVNDYTPINKVDIIQRILSKDKITGITKSAIDYINNYDYSHYGLELLYDIANHIKRNIGDDNNIKTDYLPQWLVDKKCNISFGGSELREIFEKGIFNLSDVERLVIKGAFKKCLFKKEDTAKLLGTTVTTLNKKLKSYNIKAESLMEE